MRGVTSLMYIIALIFKISTHTPHARRDNIVADTLTKFIVFQLTRLMRGVTVIYAARSSGSEDFNSHASCEA